MIDARRHNMKKKKLRIPEIVASIILMAIFVFVFRNMQSRITTLERTSFDQELHIQLVELQLPDHIFFMGALNTLTERTEGRMTPHELVEVTYIITTYCILYKSIGLTPNLILAIMEQESNYDPRAISKKKAYGLMQCIRAVFEMHLPSMGYKNFTVELALNPIINVEVAIKEIVRLRQYWLGEGVDSWMITMTSYFWGIKYTWSRFIDEGQTESNYGKNVLDKQKQISL